VTSGVTGNFDPRPGLSDTFNPLTSLELSEADEVRTARFFSPFPEAFGPTLVQKTHRRGQRVSKATAVQFLTVREAAAKLQVSAPTVYSLCTTGKLPHVRVSTSLRLALEDVEAFLRRKNRQ